MNKRNKIQLLRTSTLVRRKGVSAVGILYYRILPNGVALTMNNIQALHRFSIFYILKDHKIMQI